MIYGIGTDILTIQRIEAMYKKHGEVLPRRLLSHIEQHEFATCPNAANFLAKRFAAKEAFAKAVGTGIREPVSFRNISVGHNDLGKPEFVCETELQNWLAKQGIERVHLSLSDDSNQVVAFAVAERI
ncbi:holo-ACP synthase [Kingella negevensis]|uniref:Holo-[acyl-carrier-protein] synthase n=1 Tax=Kingella negevensis TaxID=1522312 RepID=A0A238TAP7_9NEIS|nr:holo-ACP synthase [Kingella negevensis]MDK4680712.1 holo-ACP synthase [Kingella negevensis]MDK4681564.1 holo-ACP synthase [Kingella negevensis]MDK4683648.1 holo-ACP synthase [Kingella negevensis]MDK4691952.1 holo-ACP synthase [Kingella negevensis]MDK4692894.1 holo-ACP synthase [Kingella negevensis]